MGLYYMNTSPHTKHTKYSSKIQTTGKLITAGVLQDISEKEKKKNRLHKQASEPGFTGFMDTQQPMKICLRI